MLHDTGTRAKRRREPASADCSRQRSRI
jgi:hypothetical protein